MLAVFGQQPLLGRTFTPEDERVLVNVTPGDPLTLLTVAIVLSVVALAACLLPVRRATRIDPLAALRQE
jgi:putative ABC transport system permease protein